MEGSTSINHGIKPSVELDSPDLPTTAIMVYNLLFLISAPFLLGMLATAAFCRKEINRSATWYSFILSWIIFLVCSTLLIGKRDGNLITVGFTLCLFQASVIYACRALVVWTILAMLVQLYWEITNFHSRRQHRRTWISLLIIFPYAVFVAILVIAVMHGIRNPGVVEPQNTGMYCHYSDGFIILISSTLTMMPALGIFITLGMIFIILYRDWKTIHGVDELNKRGDILPMVKRLALLILASAIPLGLGIIAAVNNSSSAFYGNLYSNLITSSTSVIISILFGTPPDNLRLWGKWVRLTSIYNEKLDPSLQKPS